MNEGTHDPFSPILSIAPMLDWTDRHYRYFIRLLTQRTLLYTEMVTSAAIVHGDRDRLLAFEPVEHPLSLQIGGDNPEEIARSIEIATAYGYDEYNLNVGCPSDRVQEGHFGACLMAYPHQVADIVRAMRSATDKPVTVKHRIGIDDRQSYEEMVEFVDAVVEAGAQRLTVHARIAILEGLSPKENRNVPPLRYEDVYRLKAERPELIVEINGGVRTLADIDQHLKHVDAVMIGRAAYETPYLLATVDHRYFGEQLRPPSRREIVEQMCRYIDAARSQGVPIRRITNHMLGLFAGRPGARKWKRALSGSLPDGGSDIVLDAMNQVPAGVLDERAIGDSALAG